MLATSGSEINFNSSVFLPSSSVYTTKSDALFKPKATRI